MDWRERIVADPKILLGKPVIKGTRIAVAHVFDLLARGWSEKDVLDNYPGLRSEDLRACLAYAKDMADNERVFPRP